MKALMHPHLPASRQPKSNPGNIGCLLTKLACWPILLCILALSNPHPALAQTGHAHLNAGALTPDAGSQLYFVNGDRYLTNSGYVVTLSLASSGQYSGYYHGSITLTAQPATANNGGPAFGHSAFGSFLEVELVSISGPPNATFGFWEESDTTPRFTLNTSSPPPVTPNRFPLSEGSPSPESDPFGHIHGRRFTTTQPGLYTLGMRIIDTSTYGSNQGPLHPASDLAYLHFQAGVTIASIQFTDSATILRFGSHPDVNVYLESNDTLDGSKPWTTVDGPLEGANQVQSFEQPLPSGSTRFYRLRTEDQ